MKLHFLEMSWSHGEREGHPVAGNQAGAALAASRWPRALGSVCPPIATYQGVEAVWSSRDSLLILIERPFYISTPEHAVPSQGGEAVSKGRAAEHLPCPLPQLQRHHPTPHPAPTLPVQFLPGRGTLQIEMEHVCHFFHCGWVSQNECFHSQKIRTIAAEGQNYPSTIRAFVIF